jgi:hypothetical protein
MTHLPGAAAAMVEEDKVRLYLLDPAHPQNGGKAGFFRSFGFDPIRWTEMARSLRDHPLVNPVTKTLTTVHGAKHLVRCSVRTPDGRNPCITTVWITEANRPPRLVTAYP